MAFLSFLTPSQTSIFPPWANPNPKPKPRTHLHASCFRPPESSIPPAMETFWHWASQNGIISAKCPVMPGLVPEGLGLVAQKDMDQNEVVLEVPKMFWINPDAVEGSEIGSVCSRLKPWVSVSLFLIREKQKEDSLWKPYIDILPDNTDSTIFWSEEELSELQGTQLLSTTMDVKELVQNEFLKAEEEVLVPNKKLFPCPITLDDFFWAFGMLRSRAFSRLSGQSFVVVPVADLMNHSSRITTQDYLWEVKGGLFKTDLVFSVRAPIPVKAGDQILIQYDLNKSNADMALDYGFVESTPGRSAYTLTFEIFESDPFFGDKLDIAVLNGLEKTAYFNISFNQPLPPKMLPYLRLLSLGEADAYMLKGLLYRNNIWDHLKLPVSRANEENVCRIVRDACRAALSGYHTTVEEDEKLEKENLDPRLGIAVSVRLGEKRVLRQIDEIFKAKESELDALEYFPGEKAEAVGFQIFWINPDTVAASEIGSVCSGLKPWVSVALFLIREKQKKEDSLWSSYIDILPEFTNSTIFWSEEELSELQGSQLLSTTLGVKELVENEFLKAEKEVLIPNKRLFPSPITLDDFFWAFGMLRSRAFTRLNGQSLVLIPLADLMNHSPSITAQDYAWEIKGAGLFSRELLFSLRSPLPVKAGGQVLIQYDLNKSNAELALDYGFVESTPGRNAYTLTLEIPESDPFYGDKLDIAESNGLGETAYFDITLGQPIPEKMLPYLRLLALGGADAFLLEGLFRNNVWEHLELPVSKANEELVCQVVRDACKTALSGYHTTVEEDEKLDKEDLDPRLEISVGIRLGEKQVLQQIDEIFEEKETEIDMLEYYQERRLRLLGLTCDEGEIIFWE
ncbi:hypothetical protein V2J09_012986 [Rumex salicifolius]